MTPSAAESPPADFWSLDADVLARHLGSTPKGVSAAEALRRLRTFGPHQIREHQRLSRALVLLNRLRNPLLLVLVFAAVASVMTGEWLDAVIVVVIVLATVTIGYAREYRAESAAAALQARVRTRAASFVTATPSTPRPKTSCRGTSCCCRPGALKRPFRGRNGFGTSTGIFRADA